MTKTSIEIIQNAITYKFKPMPKGIFTMGSLQGLPIEQPVHTIEIHHHIAVLETPVSQQMFINILGTNPSRFIAPNLPVESITWFEANEFCDRLSDICKHNIRLPRECEWEFFCRAGSADEYFFGDDTKRLREYAWYDLNAQDSTQSLAQKAPNPWGLFDVIGNVWEWCEDNYTASYMDGETKSEKRVVRGGAFDMDDFRLRSAYRSSEHPNMRLKQIGFRPIMVLNE